MYDIFVRPLFWKIANWTTLFDYIDKNSTHKERETKVSSMFIFIFLITSKSY